MNCPVCSVQLQMSERQGIEIDYCPKCRGIWLDRGELDKIIERSNSENSRIQYQERGYESHDRHRGKHADDGYAKGYVKNKKSFLMDLFD